MLLGVGGVAAPLRRVVAGARARLRGLLLGLPTTRAGVEMLLALGFVGWRMVALGQLGLSVPAAWDRTTSRALFVVVLTVFAVFSAVLTLVLAHDRAHRRPGWAWADVALGVGVLLSQRYFVMAEDVVGSWTAWGFALTINTTFGAVIALRRWWHVTGATVMLAGSYLVVSLPAATRVDVVGNVVSNSAGYLGFALLAGPVVAYLRRLGSQADESREAAALAARRAEADRHRLLLHDHATVLRLLSQPHLDPTVAELLRRQAAAGSHRVRTFLARGESQPRPLATARQLPEILVDATDGFDDLPIEMNTDLARGVSLEPETAQAVERAVCTLLHNTRLHANAHQVLIHADAADQRWEVTIRDDGDGFDPDSTGLGFGLRVQVVQTLAAHRIDTRISSAPGDGTAVTITGRLTAAP